MSHLSIHSQRGFAHPVLLIFLIVAVVGVVGFSGHRVVSRNRSANVQTSSAPQGQIIIAPQGSTQSESNPGGQTEVSINSPASAAAAPTPSAGTKAPTPQAQTGTIKVSSQYDVSTPMGSLSQLIFEARQGDYGNALYFVTPEFVSKAYNSVGAQDFSQFVSNCQSNETCKMLLATKVNFDLSHITESYCSVPAGFSECKKVGTKFVLEDNTLKTVYYKSVGFHVHEASVTMLKADNSTNWVINQVSVDNFTL